MPPPEPVATALKHILEAIPDMDDSVFQKAENETKNTITYDGKELVFRKSGVSRSNPHTMGYSFVLRGLSATTYRVWLLSPSTDPQLNRQAVTIGLEYLIYEAGSATISRQVDMTAPPFV